MKLSNNGRYLVTLTGSNINSANYNTLKADQFNSSVMNSFAVGIDSTLNPVYGDDFFGYNSLHPSNYDDLTTPSHTIALPRFWRHDHKVTTYTNGAGQVLYHWVCDTYYLLGVRVYQYCGRGNP